MWERGFWPGDKEGFPRGSRCKAPTQRGDRFQGEGGNERAGDQERLARMFETPKSKEDSFLGGEG